MKSSESEPNGQSPGFEAQPWVEPFEGRGIYANLGPRNADSCRTDLHPDLKTDSVPVRKSLANPPFNMSDWGGEHLRQDVRWKFGMPPVNNANYAWIQPFLHHLAALREALLPKLLSGELRVANAVGIDGRTAL